ncbi:hypothetical protein [Microcoleus vaginatus]|uniref:hypothetical protein n=1 Tax=Microcoleus vaginatus TaxID=119532 RepID=UPI001F60BA84|nr:hypothetical protein D0A37_22320 [Microcoleus vaginatus HSN003]
MGRRKKEDGRRKKEEGRRKKEEGRRKKEDGRRKKEEGRRKTEEGRRKTEEGRRKKKKYLIVDIEGAGCEPYLSLPVSANQSHSMEVHLRNFGKGRCAGRTLGL